MRTKLRSLLLLTIPAIIISLLIGEVAIRIWWDDKSTLPVWVFADLNWENKNVHLNRLGFRGSLPDLEKPADVFRIVAIGDSHTYGKGIDNPNDRYAEVTGALLARNIGRKVEVINFGTGGFCTDDELKTLRNLGISYQPDLVLLQYHYDDVCPKDWGANAIESMHLSSLSIKMAEKSYLFGLLRAFYLRSVLFDKLCAQLQRMNNSDSPEMLRMHELLIEIRDLCKNANAELAAVIFPVPIDLDKEPYLFQNADDSIVAQFKSLGIQYQDLLPLWKEKGYRGSEIWSSPLDPHPNKEVHKLAALKMLPIVRKLALEHIGKQTSK